MADELQTQGSCSWSCVEAGDFGVEVQERNGMNQINNKSLLKVRLEVHVQDRVSGEISQSEHSSRTTSH